MTIAGTNNNNNNSSSSKKKALSIEAAVVYFSRVCVGDHYPLDVAGGIFLGDGISSLWL